MRSFFNRQFIKVSCIVGLVTLLFSCSANTDWKVRFESVLPEFGHRNWIVVADYAYPFQSAPGIETIATGQEHGEVLNLVLKRIEEAPHIKPMILLDEELASVSEADAPGVKAYLKELDQLLVNKNVTYLLHEQIIKQLDTGAELFNILILKTNMTIPYSSVFIELDCGYWNADKEKRLRETIEKKSIEADPKNATIPENQTLVD